MGIIRVLVVLLLLASPAFAQPQCYAPEQAEAEDWLRLHSELMVITVTCRQGSGGENLVPLYTKFTKSNIKALRQAEAVMADFYRSTGEDGIAQLDRLRTKLGNEFGQKIAELSAPVFCQMYRDKVLQMCDASHDEVAQQVAELHEQGSTYLKICSR